MQQAGVHPTGDLKTQVTYFPPEASLPSLLPESKAEPTPHARGTAHEHADGKPKAPFKRMSTKERILGLKVFGRLARPADPKKPSDGLRKAPRLHAIAWATQRALRDSSISTHVGMKNIEERASASLNLPVISTLCLGAGLELLYDKSDYVTMDGKTRRIQIGQALVMISLAVCITCNLYATAFSVVEAYYLQLSVGADEWMASAHSDIINDEEINENRESLHNDVEAILVKFDRQRQSARGCLWIGLASLVMAAIGEMLVTSVSWLAISVSGILAFAVIWAIGTVLEVRRTYRPLLAKYQGVGTSNI